MSFSFKKTLTVASVFLLSSCLSPRLAPLNSVAHYTTPISIPDTVGGYDTVDRLQVSFTDRMKPIWDGKTIKQAEFCKRFRGNGRTPELLVKNIPPGANVLVVEFNDHNCSPLSFAGGLGSIGYIHQTGVDYAIIPRVQGESRKLPRGTFKEKGHRAAFTGSQSYMGYCDMEKGLLYPDFAKTPYKTPAQNIHDDIYLPPCTGGMGHYYFADVKAYYRTGPEIKRGQKLLAIGRIELGNDKTFNW